LALARSAEPHPGLAGGRDIEEWANRSEKYRNYFNDWGEGKSSEIEKVFRRPPDSLPRLAAAS
jgi:hypothetical protein